MLLCMCVSVRDRVCVYTYEYVLNYAVTNNKNVKPWMTKGMLSSCKCKQKFYHEMILGRVSAREYMTYKTC